jgi:phenylacetate-CoA ligase/benzoylacetate-CoA ligase
MLIYKAMNVFPSAIRDIVLSGFSDVVEPYMRIWKDRADQVRFDEPIPLEIEVRPGVDASRLPKIGQDIEAELRNRLQVRIRARLVEPGTIPRSAYKTALVHVRRDEKEDK